MSSLWMKSVKVDPPVRSITDSRFDYVVVGGGITGVTTALLLGRSGADVALVEARQLGAVATGNTTAKVSVLQGTRLSSISSKHSAAALRGYVDANVEAQQWLLAFCAQHDVPFQIETAYTYAQSDKGIDSIRKEFQAGQKAGLDVRWVDDPGTPFPSVAAVALDNQAQFHPLDALEALVAEAQRHGVQVYENTRVVSVHSKDGDQILRTDQVDPVTGDDVTVRGRKIILATGTPILDRGGFFARVHPERSYAAAFSVSEPIMAGMYLAADQPSRSVRWVPGPNGEPLLLTGGSGHPVGRAKSEQEHVDELIDWTTTYFPTAELTHQWSAQDYITIDELPYVGPILPGHDSIYVATGFAKWGMTNGVAAALALAGRLLGGGPAWAEYLDSSRPAQVVGVPSAAVINAEVGLHMAKGWAGAAIKPGSSTTTDETVPEGGGVLRRDGARPTGVCTVEGQTHKVSAVCPHLAGVLNWNDAEKSWDCPLHGSRFAADGAVLEGPATRPLTKLD
ncbi:FAD-dependent oxidoreductase [Williamsia muralis]|uniref:FAD-dependent oxidoreductase n=1 Tax=Williamsia marianensis TaxID=85044 RepID=A0ABU4EUV0_WILMA|nr:FAD-dependent oxidoreductase [Williamsia muralis]MDV7133736.1 FAD-dependent oxidoreductase [Williamsia muralis]